jgi:hypothetical protein
VELLAGQDLHGRHRLAGDRRAFAGIAIVTQTQLLLVVLGGLFVIETLSVIIQIGVFKLTRKRVFNMAPIHHHFELAGWVENTVIVRFWIIAGWPWRSAWASSTPSTSPPARCGDLRAGRTTGCRSWWPAPGSAGRPPPAPCGTAARGSPSSTPARSGPSRCARGLRVLAADARRPARRWSSPAPGWRPGRPAAGGQRRRRLEVVGEVELAWRLRPPAPARGSR